MNKLELHRENFTMELEQAQRMAEQNKYNPSDVIFIGSLIDYVIFEDYTERNVNQEERAITVVLAEIL